MSAKNDTPDKNQTLIEELVRRRREISLGGGEGRIETQEESLLILGMGLLAFILDTAGGILFGNLLYLLMHMMGANTAGQRCCGGRGADFDVRGFVRP